jgi:hypothetical protein
VSRIARAYDAADGRPRDRRPPRDPRPRRELGGLARRGRLGALPHGLARRRADDGAWFQGSAAEFIRVSREGFERGVRILHFLGGTAIDLAGDRAIAQTKMTISQRAEVEGVLCDVVCTGRFYDFLERRGGRWGLVLRQPIYEKDRLDPVDPAASLGLDPVLLGRFPDGYRHLAYAQTRIGFDVKRDMPGLTGTEVEALYARGERFLGGGPVD